MKLLDLCCGAGLAGAGYWQSGCFSEIVGVDIQPEMRHVYPFDFVCADVYGLTYDFLLQFDFIHASPPCQYYSRITPDWARENHIRSIPGIHLICAAVGVPFVIENVPGSGHDLRPNLILAGTDVGLPTDRPRLFHVQINGQHFSKISSCYSSHKEGDMVNVHGREYVSRDELIEAFGLRSLAASHLRRLTIPHIEQGIPPAMTRSIALACLPKLMIA